MLSKTYGSGLVAQIYALLEHPSKLRKSTRRGALLHVDSQRLAYVLLRRLRVPSLVVCHDVLSFTGAFADRSYEAKGWVTRALRQTALARGLRVADCIVCPSEFTRRQVAGIFPTLRTRPRVIPWGVDTSRFRPQDRQASRSILGLPPGRSILLAVGTESPRKNLEQLFRAFARIRKTVDAILLKVGRPREPVRSSLLTLCTSLNLLDDVVFIDEMPSARMPAVYAAADAFVQPSLYEGFGIPPLEALSCGTPVVASRIPSHQEVLGDAAHFVDPGAEDDLVSGLAEILTDRGLARMLSERGPQRASQFPWSRCVDGYMEAYAGLATLETF